MTKTDELGEKTLFKQQGQIGLPVGNITWQDVYTGDVFGFIINAMANGVRWPDWCSISKKLVSFKALGTMCITNDPALSICGNKIYCEVCDDAVVKYTNLKGLKFELDRDGSYMYNDGNSGHGYMLIPGDECKFLLIEFYKK